MRSLRSINTITSPRQAPTLKLLGPVTFTGGTGHIPPNRSIAEILEPLALLHLAGPTVPCHTFASTMAARTSDPTGLVSRTRSALGKDEAGAWWLPVATRHPDQRVYQLHPGITSDWTRFRELTGSHSSCSTTALQAALQLVNGVPLDTGTHLWRWADSYRESMISTIATTAHELAGRSLALGDTATARWAIETALGTDPWSEPLGRDELAIARREGDLGRAHRIANRLVDQARTAGIALDATTANLIRATNGHRGDGTRPTHQRLGTQHHRTRVDSAS